MLSLTVGGMLPLLIWREWRKGNDLTVVMFFELLFLTLAVGAMGFGSWVVGFFLWRWPPDRVEWLGNYQPNSIYEKVGNKTILLRGSKSAKAYRALMSSDVEF